MPTYPAVRALPLHLVWNEHQSAETTAILELRELIASPVRQSVLRRAAHPGKKTFRRHLETMALLPVAQLCPNQGSRLKNPSSATTIQQYRARMPERFSVMLELHADQLRSAACPELSQAFWECRALPALPARQGKRTHRSMTGTTGLRLAVTCGRRNNPSIRALPGIEGSRKMVERTLAEWLEHLLATTELVTDLMKDSHRWYERGRSRLHFLSAGLRRTRWPGA